MPKSIEYYQDKMFEAIEWIWTEMYTTAGYEDPKKLNKKIREFLINDVELMIDEMERFEREVGRDQSAYERRKLR